jgi:hypothetical protein
MLYLGSITSAQAKHVISKLLPEPHIDEHLLVRIHDGEGRKCSIRAAKPFVLHSTVWMRKKNPEKGQGDGFSLAGTPDFGEERLNVCINTSEKTSKTAVEGGVIVLTRGAEAITAGNIIASSTIGTAMPLTVNLTKSARRIELWLPRKCHIGWGSCLQSSKHIRSDKRENAI